MDSVDKNIVTTAQSANAVGKTHGAGRIAVAFYKMHPGAQVYTAAAPPEGNLKRLLWGEINKIKEKFPHMFANDNPTTLNIQRSAAEFITGVTIPASGTSEEREARFSGKHAPYILFILDEGDGIPPEVYKGIESCLSGGHIRLLIMFNPRRKSGPVYQRIKTKQTALVQMGAFTHPNVVTGKDVFPGAVSRDVTVRRINEWSRPLRAGEKVDENCFEVPDFLVGTTAKSLSGVPYPPLPAGMRFVTESTLFYMVLGVFPAQASNQLISEAWIMAAVARWTEYTKQYGMIPPQNERPIIGQDVAELGSDWNVACLRYDYYINAMLDDVHVWGGVDTLITGERCSALYKRTAALYAAVDGTGVGAGVWPVMNRMGCTAFRVMTGAGSSDQATVGDESIGNFDRLRDELWWKAREWLKNTANAMLPPDEKLIEELLAPSYEVNDRGKVKITAKSALREILRRSPDKADAFVLTFASADEQTAILGGVNYAGMGRSDVPRSVGLGM